MRSLRSDRKSSGSWQRPGLDLFRQDPHRRWPRLSLSNDQPDATLAGIYIVRNPLDVSISFARHWDRSIDDSIAMMGTDNFESATTELTVCEFLGSWSQNVASWVSITRHPVQIIRYEDMLDNPLRPFSNLARLLRMSPSGAQLKGGDRQVFLR
jgi:hypothetical protein